MITAIRQDGLVHGGAGLGWPCGLLGEQVVQARGIGGEPEDYSRGMAAFQVDDLARTRVLPIRNGRGRSLAGQGLTARWRRFRRREVRS